jgi:general stress protein YciG
MMKDDDKVIRQYLSEIARKGGKARAKKYDKKTLSKWGKKGGRPPSATERETK